MKTGTSLPAILAALLIAVPVTVEAGPHWKNRDIRHFHERDIHYWATGH